MQGRVKDLCHSHGCGIRHQDLWARLESAFPGKTGFNEPLKQYTSFGIGGPADCLVTVTSGEKLMKLLALIQEWEAGNESVRACDRENAPALQAMPFFVLGKGTNLLVKDGGIRGLVIRLDGEFSRASVQGDLITAGAACPLSSLLRLSIQHGLSGLEFATGIPGSLGGAIRMNAGSAEEGIGSVVREVRMVYPDGSTGALSVAAETPGVTVKESAALSSSGGTRADSAGTSPVQGYRYDKDHLQDAGDMAMIRFAYRRCFLPREGIITHASVQLRQVERKEAIVAQIRERYRYRAAHQPLREKSAGCIFKNPPGESAGKLIEQAGLKGTSIGDAQVSTIHANFINNRGSASCSDVLRLMEMIQEKIYYSFGIVLEPEVQVVGEERESRGLDSESGI